MHASREPKPGGFSFDLPLKSHHGEESFGRVSQKMFALARHLEEHLSLLMMLRV